MTGKVYSIYFPEDFVYLLEDLNTPYLDKDETKNKILQQLFWECITLIPTRNISVKLRPTLIAMKTHIYNVLGKKIEELQEVDVELEKLHTKKEKKKEEILNKIMKL